jgi:hypothetical protein
MAWCVQVRRLTPVASQSLYTNCVTEVDTSFTRGVVRSSHQVLFCRLAPLALHERSLRRLRKATPKWRTIQKWMSIPQMSIPEKLPQDSNVNFPRIRVEGGGLRRNLPSFTLNAKLNLKPSLSNPTPTLQPPVALNQI